ncbi:uncharacterized protein LOC134944252 [Pseudophryne corroboree]|uniref:uncharacterized protein LOC134944252 n=1 Tax=Pseudophryne corroboree TaxID=495146 RepID=UPI0030818B22
MDNSKTSAILSQLSSQFTSLSPEWRKFLLSGIWSRITQNLNSSANQSQWIPVAIQPFLVYTTPGMVQCLQQKNVTCATFQELVKNLDLAFPMMTNMKRQELYPALKLFLSSRQNASGLACSLNTNSSVWIKQNLGKFSAFGEYSDFLALNTNFSALDVLPVLTVPQLANFSLDLDAANNSAAISSVLGTLQNASDVYTFLTYLNADIMSKNMSAVHPPLAQALLNKTFAAIKSNISAFTTQDWTQLFQDKLNAVLPAITPDQISLIGQNLSCDSYQAM